MPAGILSEKRWVLGAGFAVVFFAYAVVFEIVPRAQAVISKGRAWQSSRSRLSKGREVGPKRERLRHQRHSLQKKLNALFVSLPASDRMSAVLNVLQNEARDAEVALLEVQPLEEERHATYDELPVQVVLRARYHAFGRFVSRLEQSRYLMSVEEIHAATPEAMRPHLRVSLKVSVKTLRLEGKSP